jgi:hypothetical protein
MAPVREETPKEGSDSEMKSAAAYPWLETQKARSGGP